MSIDLVNRSVAEMFTISDADWEAISTRVDAVIHLSGVADEVTQYLPGFKALLGQCQLWRDHTLNEIGSSATQLVGYCNQAIDRFGALQTVLAGPLTPAGQQEVVDTSVPRRVDDPPQHPVPRTLRQDQRFRGDQP